MCPRDPKAERIKVIISMLDQPGEIVPKHGMGEIREPMHRVDYSLRFLWFRIRILLKSVIYTAIKRTAVGHIL